MNVLITLTTAGADTGPFNLYSNTDSYVTAFQTNIAKSLLVAGYTSTVVPAGTTTVRVKSTGLCTTYVDLFITGPSTTTTTTTAPVGPTTTTTTTAGGPTTTTTTTTAAPSNQWYQLTDCDTLAVDYSAMYPPSGTQFVLNQRVIDLASTIWKVTQIYTSSPGGSGLFIGPTGFTGCPGDPTTTTTTSTSTSTSSTTTTTTTTATPTTTTTTTNILVSCEEWRNDTLEEATITYTPCGSGTPVSNYALATTSSVCAVYGSITVTVGGPLTLVGSCS